MGDVTASNSTNRLIIYHQNIRRLMSKKGELNIIMQDKIVSPHLICLSEHHLKTYEIAKFSLNINKIAANFCREGVSKGGVCIMYGKA